MPDTDLWQLLAAGMNLAAALTRLATTLLHRRRRPTRRPARRRGHPGAAPRG